MRQQYLVMLCIVHSLYVMSADIPKTCLLKLLPEELCNKIAWYLDFCETDEEFITRTKKENPITAEHIHMRNSSYRAGSRRTGVSLISAYSIDNSKILTAEVVTDNSYCRQMWIYNIKTNCGDYTVDALTDQIRQFCSAGNIKCIALSRDQRMVALVTSRVDEDQKIRVDLNIAEIPSAKTSLSIECSEIMGKRYKKATTVAFNKQGTKVIVHRKKENNINKKCVESEKPYYIQEFELEEVHNKRSICTLKQYFSIRGICKEFQC